MYKCCLLAAAGILVSAAAESFTVFDPAQGQNRFNTFANASCTPAPDGFSIEIKYSPDGKQNGTFQVFQLPPLPADGKFDRLVIRQKGDGSANSVILVIETTDGGSYCWNGHVWDPSAEISIASARWEERSFRFDEFRPAIRRTDDPPFDWHKIHKIQISGVSKKNPSTLHIGTIRLASGAVSRPVETTVSPVEIDLADPVTPARTGPAKWRFHPVRTPRFADWNSSGAYRETTAAREKLYLNHYWQFIPVVSSSVQSLSKGTGELPQPGISDFSGEALYTKVPGRWDGRYYNIRKADGAGISRYRGIAVNDFAQAYLRRTVQVPAGFAGRQFILEFRGVQVNGELFINGVPAHTFRKSASVDITSLLVPGRENEIVLLVGNSALPLKKSNRSHADLQRFGTKWWYNFSEGPGIIDDVILHAVPREVKIGDMQMIPSVGKGELGVNTVLVNNGTTEKRLTLSAEISDHGTPVFSIPAGKVSLKPGEKKPFSLRAAWPGAKRWTPDSPMLYESKVTLRDADGQVVDEVFDRFGYREFGVKGSDFVLNGTPIRLNWISDQGFYRSLAPENLRDVLKAYKTMHFNGIMIEDLNSQMIRLCDELGLMVVMRHVFTPLVRSGTYLPGVPNKGLPYQIYLGEGFAAARKELESQVATIVTSFRNNPSIVMWAVNPLLVGAADWIAPGNLLRETPDNDVVRATMREEAFLRTLDPVREVHQSMAGPVGIANACNPYPTFGIQPDEWADWPMLWSKAPENAKKPLVLEEVALPYLGNWGTWGTVKGSRRFRQYHEIRQIFLEQAARYAGDSLYTGLPAGPYWSYLTDYYSPLPQGGVRSAFNPAAEAGTLYWMDRVFKFWRFYGISGIWSFTPYDLYFSYAKRESRFYYGDVTAPGRKPDRARELLVSEMSPVFHKMRELQRPFLAFLGNGGPYISSLEHNYYGGETVEKQILMSNQAMRPVDYEAEWKLIDEFSGDIAASGVCRGKLDTAESAGKPFRFTLPEVKERRDFRLELAARGWGERSEDSFRITAFPRPEKTVSGKVLLYDETGATRRMLKELGVRTVEFDGRRISADLPLVVGSGSFSRKFMELAGRSGLPETLENGMSILIMAQGENGGMAEYAEERRTRHVFSKDASHPVLAGIRAADLHHWRGKSELVEEFPRHSAKPDYFQFWGAKDVVAPFVLDKPYDGRFRVILDADANLGRAVLLEQFYGKGRILFNQLELENRIGLEPAADILARNLLSYLQTPEKQKTAVAGTVKTFDSLRGLRFDLKPVENDSGLAGLNVLILELPLTRISANAVAKFVENGGSLFLLDASAEALKKSALPFRLPLFRKKVSGSLVAKNSPLLRGLGNSDFYFNMETERNLLDIGQGAYSLFGRIGYGSGEVIVLGLRPGMYAGTHAEFQVKRILSGILGNLGAASSARTSFGTRALRELNLTGTEARFRIDPENSGLSKGYATRTFADEAWGKQKLGICWENQGITTKNPNPAFKVKSGQEMNYDGYAWYRIHVTLPEAFRGRKPRLAIRRVDDTDEVWFNGSRIGGTGQEVPNHWEKRRDYPIPENLILFGKENVIAVRVGDFGGEGGIIGDIRITYEGAESGRTIFFGRSPRTIFDFDPNAFRQW